MRYPHALRVCLILPILHFSPAPASAQDTVKIALATDQHIPKLQAEARCRAHEQLQRLGVLGIRGGNDGHAHRGWHDFLDQLESFWPQLLIEKRDSRSVAART